VASPWQAPERDPSVARLLARRAPDSEPEPSRLRDPARALILAGAVVAIIASPLPWLVRVGNPPPQTVTGWSGVADGFFLAIAALGLASLAWSRGAAASPSVLLRGLPAVLGVVAIAFGIGALRSMENRIHIWEREGATGVHQPALWIFVAGAALLASGGLWLGVRALRDPTRPRAVLTISAETARWAALGTVGAVGGAGIVAAVILNSGLDPVAMSLPLLVGVMIGAIVGGNAGGWLARRRAVQQSRGERAPLDQVVPTLRVRGPADPPDRDVP
jgi:hypothetical protein